MSLPLSISASSAQKRGYVSADAWFTDDPIGYYATLYSINTGPIGTARARSEVAKLIDADEGFPAAVKDAVKGVVFGDAERDAHAWGARVARERYEADLKQRQTEKDAQASIEQVTRQHEKAVQDVLKRSDYATKWLAVAAIGVVALVVFGSK